MSASKRTTRRSIGPLPNLPTIEFNLPSSGSSSVAGNDGASPVPLVAGRTPVMTANDDTAERHKRRQHRVHELNQQNGSSPSRDESNKRLSVAALASNSNITGLSTSDLSNYYSKCIQMSSENKITAKNAFGLHLIDCMTEMLKNKDSNMDNFQMVGCTLDASAKIYGYRVDFVHIETQKIASGLSRSSPSANSSKRNLSNDDDDAELSNENNLQKKKRKKVNRTSNIEKNPKNLNINRLTDQSEVNPMFVKTTELFTDSGSGASVLLASLGCRNDNCALVLDSMDPLESVTNDENAASNPTSAVAGADVDLTQFLSIFESVASGEQRICPEFADFEFSRWEPGDTLEARWGIDHTSKQVPTFQAKENNEPQEGDIFDHGNDADFDTEDAGDVAGTVIDPPATDERDTAALMNMTAGLALEPNEYSYFKKDFASAWAGPNHWHIKPIAKGVKTTTAREPKPKRPAFRLLFSSSEDALKDLEYAFEHTDCPKRLSKETRKKWSQENTTLIEDTHYQTVALRRLFLRPFVEICRKLPVNQSPDADLQNYNYENPNDVENFCPANAVGENGRHSVLSSIENAFSPAMSRCFPESHFDVDTQMGGSQEAQAAFTGDNLIQQPQKVATFRIPYMHTAKRVNVRHVKQSIWTMLQKGLLLSDATTIKDAASDCTSRQDTASDCTSTPDRGRKEQSFHHLYRSLPEVLSAENAANMSYAMAFLCTLHLANENNLELISQKDMKDFSIYLPEGEYDS